MKTNTESTNASWAKIQHHRVIPWGLRLLCLAALALALAVPAQAQTTSPVIPFSDLGARATADYHGDALSVTVIPDGARLRCGFQKLQAHATPEGLWLESTAPGAAGKLRVTASDICRSGPSTLNPQLSTTLPATGTISVQDQRVRFTRAGLTEEYSVSVDGVRQDFVIATPPAGTGNLRVELALSGARAETAAGGIKLTLEGSGRTLAYSRLRVEDATGRELAARMEVLSADGLTVSVADVNATYPIRIDPTFSDADWVSLNPGIPGANNLVSAIAVDDSANIYVGGEFILTGTVLANCIAKWDGTAWSALGSGIGGVQTPNVLSLAVCGTNLYAGGYFATAGGVAAANIAKWNGSAWSALGSGMNYYSVSALAVIGTDLYAGGSFTTAGGVAAIGIAKWDGSRWSALGSGMNSYAPAIPSVAALAVSGNDLYAGGNFTVAGGVAATNIAKWDGSTWSALGSGMNGSVSALAVSGTDLYAGGSFTTADGVEANRIAKWNGSTWSALGPGMNATVYALAVSGTDLYAGGDFLTAGEVSANRIAKWDGSSWSALGSGMENTVLALAVGGTNLYAGGGFTSAGGVPANFIAKWDGSAWSALGSGMSGNVTALALSGTDLYAGGSFTTAGGVPANYIAKWNGSAWSALGSGIGGGRACSPYVTALAVSGTELYAGGNFLTAGGVPATNIAKWDGSAWSALGSGIGSSDSYADRCRLPYVIALAVSGTELYAGGYFTKAGGVPANYIAKWDGSAWSALGSGVSGAYSPLVTALAVRGTELYAGGNFLTAGGVSANRIAKWNGSAWSALDSGVGGSPSTDDYVSALAVSGTDLYAGGNFLTAGGVSANRIAKWNGSAWSALGSGMGGSSQYIYALALSGTDLYAGGYFTTAGGVPANCIARWNGSAWSALGSGTSGPWPFINALAADGAGHLFVGGDFYLAGTNVSPYLAQANLWRAPTILMPPQTQTAEAGAILEFTVVAAGEPATAYQWYFNGTNEVSGISTNSELLLTNVSYSESGTYTVIITNAVGAVTSAPVMLNVIAPVVRRWVPGINVLGDAGSLLNVDYINALSPAPVWTPLGSVSLISTSQFYFDLTAPLPPQRFYRAWQSGAPSVIPSLDLHLIPAITLTGNPGNKVRVDGINQFGPTGAWFTLGTVTLTNTSQLYFDVSVIGQPQRLYRLVPVP